MAQGVGVTFLPELYAKGEVKEGGPIRLYSIPPRFPAYWTSAVCYYRSEYMPVTVEAFLEVLRDWEGSFL